MIAESKIKTVLLTVISCAVVAVLGGIAFIYSGLYNVAAIVPDNPFVAWALHEASDRSVAARLGDIEVPDGLDQPERIKAGAKLFGENCIVCHGGPGLKPTSVALGINPAPVDLFEADRDAELNETFWFVRNGVKMTGMPGFAKSLSETEIWSLVAFLATTPGMTAEKFADQTGIGGPPTGGDQVGG